MAKFTTVLCILFVVGGSYGSFFDTLTASVTNAISSASSTSNSLAGMSSLTNVASSVASAASSAATSSGASSVISSMTDTASSLANAASSTSGMSSLFSGITSAITSATNSSSSNPLMSLFTRTSTSWITIVCNQMKTQMDSAMVGFKSAVQIALSTETVGNDAIKSAIGQFGTVLDSMTNTDIDVSACTSMASEVESIAASAVMNTTTCTSEVIDEMQSNFDTLMTRMANFLEDLKSFAEQVDTCTKDFWTSMACMANVGSTTGTQAMTDFSSTMNEVTVIMSDMAGVQTKMEGCGIQAAQNEVKSKILTYTVKISECMTEMGAAGLSGGSSSAAVAAATKALTSLTNL